MVNWRGFRRIWPLSVHCPELDRGKVLSQISSESWLSVAYNLHQPGSMPEHIRKKLADEIAVLERELNHELPKELKKAVAMGDLSENAEYHMAKQRQEFVRARLGQLKQRMADLSMVNMANIPRDRAAIGSTVLVYDSTKEEEIEYKLVTSEESDVTKGLISTSSPIGRALMGKKVGDVIEVVTPAGKRELEVLKLVTVHDEA
jgi:transcription elongation factor GreA